MSRCRSCKHEITWVRLNGRAHPIDVDKVPNGNIEITDRPENGSPEAVIVHPDPAVMRFISHFATCKDYLRWRKGKR